MRFKAKRLVQACTAAVVFGVLFFESGTVVAAAATPNQTCYNYYTCVMLQPGTSTSSFYMLWQGVNRQVVLVRPTATPSGKVPALVLLHGSYMSPTQMANVAQVSVLAAQLGYWVILPAADGIWNINTDQSSGTDDIGFIANVVNTATAQYPVDKTRVSIAGFSKGAFLAEVLACERPELFAAAAIVAGTMTGPDIRACAPSRPLPIMYVMGTADTIVNYAGAYGQDSAPQDFSYWGGMLACDMSRATKSTLPVTVNDGTTVTQQRVNACTAGGEVDFYTVTNGGHAWPGYVYSNPGLGIVSQNLNATLTIGQFAARWTTASTH